MSGNTAHSSSMSRSDSAPGVTRRDLQQLSAERLRTIASELHLTISGRKSALVDRILRHRRQAARVSTDSSPATRERSPPAPARAPANSSRDTPPSHSPNARRIDHLHWTVQHLVDESLQGLEERLLRSLRPLAAGNTRAASDENISLPSPPPPGDTTADRCQPPSQPGAPPTASPAPVPPTVPLPEKVKQKIIKGEYIDFDTLLPESLYPMRHGTSPFHAFTLRLSNDPAAADEDVVIAQQKPASRRSIRDLSSWMEAWNIYIQVLVSHFPSRASSLLAYQSIICGASIHFPPRCWLRYDQRFRASAAADKTLRWDTKSNDLWLECFTQPSATQPSHLSHFPSTSVKPPSRRPCTYCGSLYHYPENCPLHPFRASRRTPLLTSPTSSTQPPPPYPSSNAPTSSGTLANQPLPYACRDFNNGPCRRRPCRFHHVCRQCSDAIHEERDCLTSC